MTALDRDDRLTDGTCEAKIDDETLCGRPGTVLLYSVGEKRPIPFCQFCAGRLLRIALERGIRLAVFPK